MSEFFSRSELKNYWYILLGSIVLGLAVVWFFVPNQIITGGTAGLALLLHYVTPFTIGSLMVAVNAPLLLLGGKYLGKMFAIRTIVTIALISLMIDFFVEIIQLKPFVEDTILAAIFGGIFIGVGLALVIKGNSSAGGSTIIARIVSANSEIKPSTVILVIDSLIILSSLFIFEDTQKVLWSIVSIYITVKIIDKILTGNLNKKVVYLVSNNVDVMREKIRDDLGPDGTILNGQGLHEHEDKKMILIIVEVTKLQQLRQLVSQYDPDGFLIITEATEFLGRGH